MEDRILGDEVVWDRIYLQDYFPEQTTCQTKEDWVQAYLKDQKERYGIQYEFHKILDTTERFKDPAHWIAENLAQFINLMLMNIPVELTFQAREKEAMVKKVLANIFEVSQLILEKKMVYGEKEFVADFYEWLWQSIMDFLYGKGGLCVADGAKYTKWSIKEIDEAKPRAIKLLLQDLEAVHEGKTVRKESEIGNS